MVWVIISLQENPPIIDHQCLEPDTLHTPIVGSSKQIQPPENDSSAHEPLILTDLVDTVRALAEQCRNDTADVDTKVGWLWSVDSPQGN